MFTAQVGQEVYPRDVYHRTCEGGLARPTLVPRFSTRGEHYFRRNSQRLGFRPDIYQLRRHLSTLHTADYSSGLNYILGLFRSPPKPLDAFAPLFTISRRYALGGAGRPSMVYDVVEAHRPRASCGFPRKEWFTWCPGFGNRCFGG